MVCSDNNQGKRAKCTFGKLLSMQLEGFSSVILLPYLFVFYIAFNSFYIYLKLNLFLGRGVRIRLLSLAILIKASRKSFVTQL